VLKFGILRCYGYTVTESCQAIVFAFFVRRFMRQEQRFTHKFDEPVR
jgi:hypothetical protein